MSTNASGFYLVPAKNVFELADRNECLDPKSHDCSEAATCINTFGSFTCECSEGFVDKGEYEFPGRKCEPLGMQDTTEERPFKAHDDDKKWKILAYSLAVLLLVDVFLIMFFILIQKKYAHSYSKMVPEPDKSVNSAFAGFPETKVSANGSQMPNQQNIESQNSSAEKYLA